MLQVEGALQARLAVEVNPFFRPPKEPFLPVPYSAKVAQWLTQKNIQPISVIMLGVDFFCMLYMRDVVPKREKAIEVALAGQTQKGWRFADPVANAWYTKLLSEFETELRFIDNFMFTYLCAATAGELRHAPSKTGGSVPNSVLQKWKIAIDGNILSRSETQKNFLLHASTEDAAAYLKDATDAFTKHKWSSAFGGAKWGQIAATGLKRTNGELDPVMFVDRVFDLKHNGGPMFDKNSVVSGNSTVGKFLDSKLNISSDGGWNAWLPYGTRVLYQLIQEARSLGLWKTDLPSNVNSASLPATIDPIPKGVGEDAQPTSKSTNSSTQTETFKVSYPPCPKGHKHK